MSPFLSMPSQATVSLYVHIPFCTVKCGYCDFFSRSQVAPERMAATVSAILADARLLLPSVLSGEGRVESVYIGGGTPSVLPPKSLELLVNGIRECLPNAPEEWSVELNPETLTAPALEIFGEAGVTRLSLGVQTLSEKGLRALGRAATVEATYGELELLQGMWRGRWNADLIVGFTGDSPERVDRDITHLSTLGARHLSVYALTVEEGTPLAGAVRSGGVELPGEDETVELLGAAREALLRRGFRRYEVSNYALPGEESLHNLRYWRMEPYLGLGPAAASTVYLPEPPLRGLRLEGVRDLRKYLASPEERYLSEELSTEELLEEHLLMGLRTAEGVSLRRLQERFGLSPEAIATAVAPSPLLEIHRNGGDTLRVPPEQWNLLDRGVLQAAERLVPLLFRPY